MSVSYHLIPINKETGKFENLYVLCGSRHSNDISKLGDTMLTFTKETLQFFDVDQTYYDFIFSLRDQEVSTETYDPKVIKEKLLYTRDTLKSESGFPIPAYNYFKYAEDQYITYLYATILGSELKSIVNHNNLEDDMEYNISIVIDIFSNYEKRYHKIEQFRTTLYVYDKNKERISSFFNYKAFPSKIKVIELENKPDVKEIELVLKSPFEHFENELNNLIGLCDDCIKHNLGIKSHVSH